MLTGGKLIDSGSYGCIFTPPLECKNKKKQEFIERVEDLPISKISLKEDAEQEYSISKIIRQIPLWKNYFVVSESICEPALVQKDKEFSDCALVKGWQISEFRILAMAYGGEQISRHRFNLKTFDFMGFIIHFIECGALLNLFGVVNRDIHGGNILVDKNDVPRIIDFNLAVTAYGNITSNQLRHKHDINLGQEPPDSTLVNAISFGYNPQIVINSIVNRKPIIRKIRSLLQVPSSEMTESLEAFYNKSKAVKSGNDATWFKTYWRTIDSWAIGANIVDFITMLSIYSEFLPILRRARTKLFPVLRRLCAVSPLDRIDCVQALNYLAPNSFILRKYGKAWLAKVGTGNIA